MIAFDPNNIFFRIQWGAKSSPEKGLTPPYILVFRCEEGIEPPFNCCLQQLTFFKNK